MTPSAASLGEGEVYPRGEAILMQEWPEEDSQQEVWMCGWYHQLLKLATWSVWLVAPNR